MVHVPNEQIRPLRRSEYERLVEAGAFENERVELLYGKLVWMSPRGSPHAAVIQKLNKLLIIRLGDRAAVRPQLPMIAPQESQPEPDLAVVPPGDYFDELPRTAFLIVEVADSSVAKDRTIKAPLYAQMGVPEYWIVNLEESVIEVHTDPKDGVYQSLSRHGRDARLTLRVFDDVTVNAADLLP